MVDPILLMIFGGVVITNRMGCTVSPRLGGNSITDVHPYSPCYTQLRRPGL